MLNNQLWDENPIAALQQYFQDKKHRIIGNDGQPVVPKYKTVNVSQSGGNQTITVALTLPTGETIYSSADTAQEAKRKAALKYAYEKLNLKGTKNTPDVPSKTSAPRGYYQLGDVFSVDGNGNAHKLPKTEGQLFLGPDIWMGRIGTKFTFYRHEEPLASFEWGKSKIYGGGTFNEEKFYDASGREIYKEQFFDIMTPLIENQDDRTKYALYRGKPGTPLEQARRYSYMRPATIEEFYDTINGYIEFYKLDNKIREAQKRTHRTHGGNYQMLEGKVLDLMDEQSDYVTQILVNKNLFYKPEPNEPVNTLFAVKLKQALQK